MTRLHWLCAAALLFLPVAGHAMEAGALIPRAAARKLVQQAVRAKFGDQVPAKKIVMKTGSPTFFDRWHAEHGAQKYMGSVNRIVGQKFASEVARVSANRVP